MIGLQTGKHQEKNRILLRSSQTVSIHFSLFFSKNRSITVFASLLFPCTSNEMLSEANEKEHNPQFFFEKYNQFIIRYLLLLIALFPRSVLEQKICYTEDNKQPLYFFVCPLPLFHSVDRSVLELLPSPPLLLGQTLYSALPSHQPV